MEETGKLFAVCCSSELEIKNVNAFLSQSYKRAEEFDKNAAIPCMLVIDDLGKKYTNGTEKLDDNDDGKGIFSSPFVDRDPEDIQRMVHDFKRNTKSDVDLTACIILDRNAVRDQWGWVRHIAARKSEPEVKMVKVAWSKLYQVMMALKISHPGWEDMVKWAKSSKDETIGR